jgi:hypothetical protein
MNFGNYSWVNTIWLKLYPIERNQSCCFLTKCIIISLCYVINYSDTIVPDVKNNITYNDETNLLLNGNLGMSCMKIKNIYISLT